ncbi:MAG: hypothetical protein KAJ98_14270 [Spirochaetaceae bacterium]|nr:hypothetical protein [Spirochaetaceae bacterium]
MNVDNYCFLGNQIAKFLSLALLSIVFAVNAYGFTLTIDGNNNESFLSVNTVSGDDLQYPLWDRDKLSSGWILDIDGFYIAPADNGWIREYREVDGNHRLMYANRAYSFENNAVISSGGSHILITVRFLNNSTESVNFAPMLLLDTSLGEVTGLPFHMADGTYVSDEQFYEGTDVPDWVMSSRNSDTPSLIIFMDGKISTRPQSLTLANWLRLKQDGAMFEPEIGRDFSYLPFSEADSAVLLRYKEKRIASGESLEIALVVGLNENAPGPEAYKMLNPVSVDTEVENIRLREYALRQRIGEIRSVLDAIDILIDNDNVITGEAVTEIEVRTVNQEKLRTEYENL